MSSSQPNDPAKKSRARSRSPLAKLEQAAHRFEFFQAVRLLRWASRVVKEDRLTDESTTERSATGLGVDTPPREETIRFRSLPSHSFPQGEVARVERDVETSRHTMTVAFMGLFGPQGVLPHHYTQLIIDRVRQRDYALRDMLDLFNHRAISLFFRAWVKYHLPASFEDRLLDERPYEDTFSRAFYSLVGLGTRGSRNRLDIADDAFVYYGGLFAHHNRNAVSLERMLGDYFGVEVQIHQFAGTWLYLNLPEQSSLGAANCQLGADTVVGQRVWGVENQFRVEIGPLNYDRFHDFSPAGTALRRIAQLIRSYVGAEFEFEIQPVLRREEVPACQLDSRPTPKSPRLGWNTWVVSQPPAQHADDAVFCHTGEPEIDSTKWEPTSF